MQVFSKAIGKTLSFYARAIHIDQGKTGSPFQKKTKAHHISKKKLAGMSMEEYLSTCIYETHHEPVQAGLVSVPEDWIYSSAGEPAGFWIDTLQYPLQVNCNP